MRAARLRGAVPLRPLRLGRGRRRRAARSTRGRRCPALAAITSTLRLGTLVSPATFRHPSVLAKNAVTADHISGGRIELGIGTGWNERRASRVRLPVPADARADGPARRAARDRHPLVAGGRVLVRRRALVGGGARRAAQAGPVAAAARSWAARRSRAARRWPRGTRPSTTSSTRRPRRPRRGARRGSPRRAPQAGRDPATLRFSLMHAILIGADEAELRARADRLAEWRGEPVALDELRRTGSRGTPGRGDRAAARVRGGRRGAGDAPAPAAPRRGGARAVRVRGRAGVRVSAADAFTGARLDRAGDARRRDPAWVAAQREHPAARARARGRRRAS